jgi:hypothetical protein
MHCGKVCKPSVVGASGEKQRRASLRAVAHRRSRGDLPLGRKRRADPSGISTEREDIGARRRKKGSNTWDRPSQTFCTENQFVTQITLIESEPEKQTEALSLMHERARFMARQPGFISISLHRSLDGRRIVNYIQWKNWSYCGQPMNRPNSVKNAVTLISWPMKRS